jgi:tetratricopeptide (TPR) repeat protein
VLTAIDGESDLRAIAASLARSEFDIAKVAYGLLSTGVVELLPPARRGRDGPGVDAGPYVIQARIALAAGRGEDALTAAREALAADSTSVDARLVAARALLRLGRSAEAAEELRRAAAADADHPDVQLELAYAAARRGDLDAALAGWDRYLAANATLPQTSPVRAASRAAGQLRDLLRAHANG